MAIASTVRREHTEGQEHSYFVSVLTYTKA